MARLGRATLSPKSETVSRANAAYIHPAPGAATITTPAAAQSSADISAAERCPKRSPHQPSSGVPTAWLISATIVRVAAKASLTPNASRPYTT